MVFMLFDQSRPLTGFALWSLIVSGDCIGSLKRESYNKSSASHKDILMMLRATLFGPIKMSAFQTWVLETKFGTFGENVVWRRCRCWT